jgi:hypothetical protein
MANQSKMVKIRFRGPHPSDIETLWAEPEHDDLYRLDNSPFFAYGVSWEDIVVAEFGEDQHLEFVRCARKSGNRTVRVIFQDYRSEDPPAHAVLSDLRELRCSYEVMQPRMISVNVPPTADLDRVTDFLSQQPGLQWEYADPTYQEVNALRRM